MSEQPDTAGHTITGDGTIPADATVETRDSEIAATVKDDADSHACEGCGQTFEEIGRLLDHDCEGDWDGPDPDDDSPTALADGGVDSIETAEEFLEWSFEIRNEDCLVVTNDISGNDDRPNRATIWAAESIDVPEGVVVETEKEAEGTAPAVEDRDVEGWTKYELRLAEQALADGGVASKSAFRAHDFEDEPPSADDIPGNRPVDGTRPTEVDCPKCGASAGERCEYHGGRGAGDPKKSICIARRRAVRNLVGDRDE